MLYMDMMRRGQSRRVECWVVSACCTSLNTTGVPASLSFFAQNGIDLGTSRTAVHLAAGGNHTCAILDNADVKVCDRCPIHVAL